MSSIKSISASTKVPTDLVNVIGIDGVNEILSILWQGYKALVANPPIVISAATEEDDITKEWFAKIQRIWDSRNRATCIALNQVFPHHQYPDNTFKKTKGKKAPTIDFCFRAWNMTDSYFGAECKNLYCDRPEKIKRYVETGVENFVSGKYGSHSVRSSIVGYVLSGDITTLVDKLTKEIQKIKPINNMVRDMKIIEPQYYTSHIRRIDREKIVLYHLLFNFV